MTLSKISALIRQLPGAYRLLWAEDRISALERQTLSQGRMIQKQTRLLNRQRNMSKQQAVLIQELEDAFSTSGKLSKEGAQSLRRAIAVSRLLRQQLDDYKSSFEVSEELVEDFRAWRSETTVPIEPLVTVIVATYNRAELLTERCLPSILGQSYKNLEVLVIGDKCTDDTEARMAKLTDPRLKFINLESRGAYPEDPRQRWMVAGTVPMNKALDLARGDYVTHLDDDDEYTPERIAKLVAFSRENDCDFVWHPLWYETKDGEWKYHAAEEFDHSQVTTSSVFYRWWFTKIQWNIEAYRLNEPGDWNRFRRIKYLRPEVRRFPEPLLRHYRQNF